MTKKYVGLFIPLPPELGNQFPSLAPKDNSPPHTTFFFVGDVPPGREGEFLDVLREVFKDPGLRSPVRATLDRPEYFDSPNDGRVAVLRVLFNQDMARFRNRVLRALQAAGFPIKDSFPYVYRPHATLGYLGPDEDFTGKVPSGSWEFDQIEVWGLGDYVWGGRGQDHIMRFPGYRSSSLGTNMKKRPSRTGANPSRIASRYLRQVILRYAKSKVLRVFDFDDTLVSSDGDVVVQKPDGEKIAMSNSAFTYYLPSEGDKLDFGGANDVLRPRIIKKNFEHLKESLKAGHKVVILTARPKGCDTAVTDFLKDNGVEGVDVVALANGDPKAKGAWMDKAIDEGGYDDVEFHDDSKPNADAVQNALAKHKGIKAESFYLGHPKDDGYAGPASKKTYKAKNPTLAIVNYKPKPGAPQPPADPPHGASKWWDTQTPTFKHQYCKQHEQSQYCRGASMRLGSKNPHQKQILERAQKANNPKVSKYVKEFLKKMDQAGSSSGFFFEQVESNFKDVRKHPEGPLAGFTSRDFDVLEKVLFG